MDLLFIFSIAARPVLRAQGPIMAVNLRQLPVQTLTIEKTAKIIKCNLGIICYLRSYRTYRRVGISYLSPPSCKQAMRSGIF